jgi:hypothetical protein
LASVSIVASCFWCVVVVVVVSSAWGLSSGRVYEQVSPLFKGGYGVERIVGVSPSGNGVTYSSIGEFAGALSDLLGTYYEADRVGGVGWTSVAVSPATVESPFPQIKALSPSGASLWDLSLGPNTGIAQDLATEHQLAVRTPSGFRPVGPLLTRPGGGAFAVDVEGVSDDFCHVIVAAPALLPEVVGLDEQLYDVDTGCGDESATVKLVALNNAGGLLSTECGLALGNRPENQLNAVSSDGNSVFFGIKVSKSTSCGSSKLQLFARVGGQRTLEISKPIEEECSDVPCEGAEARAPAFFRGASVDGSRVFFMTAAPLDKSTDHDVSNDLYMATIGCPGEAAGCEPGQRLVTSLVQVSHDPTLDEAAEVYGVLRVSSDGSHVAFVARGVLSDEGPVVAGAQSLPVKGADNLYVYERDARYPAGRVVFVGDLCSGPALSGTVPDARCPGDLEGVSQEEPPRNDTALMGLRGLAQMAGGDGSVLVFSTYAQLIDQGVEADTNNAQDVYRYDMRTGALQRVSVGEDGFDGNGNRQDVELVETSLGGNLRNADARIQSPVESLLGDEERIVARQAVDEDGSRIVFTTTEPLSASASNGLSDIYEWHEGHVSLVSSGSSAEPDGSPVITPSGDDIFFMTSQGLVPADTDGAPDIYDARVGGGFPVAPAQPEECRDDACQGPLSVPAPLLVPGSVVQVPGEKVVPPKAPAVKKKKKTKKKAKKRRRVAKAKRARRAISRGERR